MLAVPSALRAAAVALSAALVAAGPTAPGQWDDRGDQALSAADALTALDSLPADAPAAVSWGEGGSRTGWFGQAWEDVDGDGCDTRNEILSRDLTDVDYSRAKGIQGRDQGVGQGAAVCPDATVWSGTLHDPYTGSTIEFQRGQSTSEAVQIDHVVPLNYLYAHGAWAWDQRTRLLVANDPLNLLAVDGKANQAKSACGPATCPTGSTETGSWETASGRGWWPPNDSYRCAYAARFVSVAAAYDLGLPQADVDALRTTLTDCAAGGDGAPSALERAAGTAQSTVEVLRSTPAYRLAAIIGTALVGAGLMARSKHVLGAGRRAGRRRRRRSRRR
ncbi:HNH endonuclease family protein [Actinomyces israelii]|uniref:HNH endonuclease family protein n=1 Tax=Actinomyces israelii TaxID=1659 RepID=A0ABT4I7E6_9ACTO|nr:HNH endonuclease family protein [Actinomyces israelii]MCZ0857651.1 HNH endonuclease family protein [Actinomyces israelii]